MPHGVTAVEFAAMCQEHMPKYSARKFPAETSEPFLERCCALGLARRESQNGRTRYVATRRLMSDFSLLEDGDSDV